MWPIRLSVVQNDLRKDHPDAHYVSGQFVYLREFLIKFRPWFITEVRGHFVALGNSWRRQPFGSLSLP